MMKQKLASVVLMGVIAFNFGEFRDNIQNSFRRVLPATTENRFEERNEIREENRVGTKDAGLLKRANERRGVLGSAKVSAINGTSLTVQQGDKTYTVMTSAETKYKRKFWGESSFAEISVNDVINVVGKWNNETKTEINALWIRNLSVQKRYGVFFGEVKSLSDGSFVMSTAKREDHTVTVGSASLVNRREETIVLGDILVGHKVRIKGMWDSANKTVTEVKQIKDFSLPVVTATPTP